MSSLAGKVVLISGTAGGMGRSGALAFAAAGASVVGCDVNADGDAETEAMVRKAGGEMTSIAPSDLSSVEGAKTWVDAAAELYGGVDVLFNNASSQRVGPFDEMEVDDWHYTIRNELDIVFFTTRAAWPYLQAAESGVVINTASVAAKVGAAFIPQSAHGAAKGGVFAFTKHLSVAGADHGIRANSISPGLIRTPATAPFIDSGIPALDAMIAVTPSRRIGEPEDVAGVAVFLATDAASYINGADIVVDGGATIVGG